MHLYTSSDFGATWTARASAGSRNWQAVASNSDGTRLVAAARYGSIYISSDSGVSWTEQSAAGARDWQSLAMSSDGGKVIGGAYDSNLYLANREPAIITTFDLNTLPAVTNAATASAIKQAQLSVTSETCYTFDGPSVATLSSAGIAAPQTDVTLLGGIAFNLNCAVTGGESSVRIALDAHYTSAANLRAYKMVDGALQDITSQVDFANEQVDGTTKTTIRYNLVDGGAFDEDDVANGVIVDPIYIGVAASGELASTGVSATIMVAFGALTMVAGVLIAARSRVLRVPVRARQ